MTSLKTEFGQWFLYNDTQVQHSSLEEANTKENYILLLERKTASSESSTHNAEIENLDNVEEPIECYTKEVEEAVQSRREKVIPENNNKTHMELEITSISRGTTNNNPRVEQPPCEGVLPIFDKEHPKKNILSGEELNNLIKSLESIQPNKRTPEEEKKVRQA